MTEVGTNDREREVKLLAVSREQLEAIASRPALAGIPLTREGETDQEDLYVDTEDFRLFRAGFSLRYRKKTSGSGTPAGESAAVKVTLKDILPPTKRPLISDRRELEEVLDASALDPAAPLPGRIGAHVGPLAGSAPLRPVVRLRTKRGRCSLGDPPSGTAEVCLDRVEVLGGDGGVAGQFYELEVEDHGIGTLALTRVGEDLERSHGFLPSHLSKFERGLAVVGLLASARGEERVFDTRVKPEDRLVDSAYRVFRRHFERMKANEPGTRIGDDPEFLHDMRVSTRRIRAAFRTFRGVFPPQRLAGFNRDLKWVAATLGQVRDLDVYLETLPEYSRAIPEGDRAALETLVVHLDLRREKARASMLRTLETRRYASFLVRFERFLERGAPRRPRLPAARLPVTSAAPPRIRRTLKKVMKSGRAIPSHPAPEHLHDLRMLCKRLRYACEFFAELYGKPMKRFIRTVVELQDLLGLHQDACVAGDALRAFALSLPAKKGSLGIALVLGRLVHAQELSAAESRAEFANAWKRFDRKGPRRSMFD